MTRATLLLLLGFSLGADLVDGDTLLVLNKRDATLAFVDPAALRVVATIPTGEGPHEVAVSDDGRIAVVCNYGTGPSPGTTLSVVDVAARKELRRVTLPGLLRPHGIQASGARFYFTAEGSRAVARYDAAADRLDWIAGTGQDGTHMLVVAPGEKKVYTANIGSDSVSALDLAQAPRQTTLAQIAVVKGPEGIDLAPNGGALWVAGRTPEGGISVIDPATNVVVRTIPTTTKFANRLKFSPDGTRVVVSDTSTGTLLVFDAGKGELLRTIATGPGPAGIAFRPDGQRLYVACSGGGKVQVVDTQSWSVTGEVATGTEPDGMAWGGSK